MDTTASTFDASPLLSVDGAVATLTINRPDRLNRLTSADLLTLITQCGQLGAQTSIHVVVLRAETRGQKRPVFSAGDDVGGFEDPDHDPGLFERAVNTLEALPQVVLGAINGSVYGGATDLTLACDLRIGLRDTEFRMPACALGLHYYPSGLRRFVNVLGLQGAREMFLTASAIPVDKLQSWGAFESVHAGDVFDAKVNLLAQRIAALAPLSLRLTKQSLRELGRGEFDAPTLYAREATCLQSEDFAEGRRAFQERRAPQFKGR